ncbi:MAG: hypothetical protein AABX82_09080 [Nanoarchaeota archaeon]
MQITQTGRGTSKTPYTFYIGQKCFASAERIYGAYIICWPSDKPQREVAEALRKMYSSIKVDLVDRSDEKLLASGVYENYNGKGSIKPNITQTREGIILKFGRVKIIATLDDYCANTPPMQEYFGRDFNDNIGSVRIVTPYCDMFIEQWGNSHLSLSIMGDDRIDLSTQIVEAMRATIAMEEVATHSLLETVIGDIIERLRQQKPKV